MTVISYDDYKKKNKKKLQEEHQAWVKQVAPIHEAQIEQQRKKQNATFGQIWLGGMAGYFGNATESFLNTYEDASDKIRYATANILDVFGADNKAEKIRAKAKENDVASLVKSFKHVVQGDYSGSLSDEEIELKDYANTYGQLDDTKGGRLLKGTASGLGSTLGFASMTGYLGGASEGINATSKLGKLTKGAIDLAPIYTSSSGSAMSEAYSQGASNWEATKYGILSGGIEAGTEAMFGGLGATADALGLSGRLGLGKGALDDKIVKGLTKKFQSTIARNLVDLGIRSTGEGVEEFVSGLLTPLAKKITYMSNEELKDLYKDENLLEEFVTGTLSSLLSQAPSNIIATTTGTDVTTGLSKNERKVLDEIIKTKINQEIDNQNMNSDEKIGKLTNKEELGIRNEVEKQAMDGTLDVNEIKEALKNSNLKIDSNNDVLLAPYKDIINKTSNFATTNEDLQIDQTRLNKDAKIEDIQERVSQLEKDFKNELVNVNNTEQAHKLFGEMKNIIEATGEKVRLTSYKQLEADGQVKLLTDKNGNPILDGKGNQQYTDLNGNLIGINGFRTNNNEIFLNADGDVSRALESTLGHEIGEYLKANNQEGYKLLKELAIEVGRNDGTLTKETFDALKSAYGEQGEGAEFRTDSYLDEYVNDKIGELFDPNNTNLINEIGKKPSVIRNIIDTIKYLLQKISTKTKEGKKLLEAQHNLEKMLKQTINETGVAESIGKGNISYSVFENKDNLRYNTIDEAIEANPDKASYKKYSNNLDFFNLDLQDMKKAIKIGSKAALEARNLGLDSYSFNDANYIFDFDILDKEANTFGITNVEQIKSISKEVYDEVNTTGDSETFEEKNRLQQRPNNNDNQSIGDRTTSQELAQMDRKTTTNELATNEKEGNRNKQNELDNTRFSLTENYRGSHQIENSKDITKVNLDDIEQKVIEANGYLTKQDEKDLSKLKKILNNPNEDVTIYRASPVNELNSGDWVTTDRAYAQNVADNNGGKVYKYTVKSNELYYPDNVNDLPSLHRLSSFQYNANNNVQYSLSQDSQGRELTEQQQEYFKDSKVRDDEGRLLEMYHGSPYAGFTQFKGNNGYFFSTDENFAEDYARSKSFEQAIDGDIEIKKVYLNAKNVFDALNQDNINDLMNNISDNIRYWGNQWTKEQLIDKLQRKEVLPPKWQPEQIKGKDFGDYIGNDRNGYNNDLFVGINDNNEIVYMSNTYGSIARNLSNNTKQEIKNKLLNGEDAKFTVYSTPYGQLDKNAIYEKYNSITDDYYKNRFYEDVVKYLENGKEFMLNDSTYTLHPQTTTQETQYFDDADNWAYMETAYDENTKEDVVEIIRRLGYDGIKIYENGKLNYIVFEPNQIKNVDNTNPTNNPDIRYSLSDTQQERIYDLQKEYEELDKTREATFDDRDNLRETLNNLIRSDEYKEAQSKFMEMVKSDMNPTEIEATPEYKTMAKEEYIRKRLKDYDADVKYLTDEMTRITEAIESEEKQHRNPKKAIKEAKNIFGITSDFREAGYLLQDGTLLDFSGRNQGSNYYGKRGLDHREINEIGYDMDEFIDMGNIRMKPEAGGFELSKPLTDKQKSVLRDYIDTIQDEIIVDITKDGHIMYDSATFKKGTSASKIFNDINTYFETGKFPQQSEYADFYYSLSKNNQNDIAPYKGKGITSEQIQKQDLAPIQQQIQELSTAINDLKEAIEPTIERTDNIAPTERDVMEMVDNEGVRKSVTENQPAKIKKERNAFRRFRDTFEGSFINRNVHQDNLAKETGNMAIKHKADMLSNVMGEVNADIYSSQTNNQGQAIGKGINQLFEEANSQGLGAVLNDFLINYSNIDRYAMGKGSQTPLEVSQRLVRDYIKQYPQLRAWAEDVWQWSKNERQNLVDAGLIDQETANYLEQIYPHYVPYVSDYENADSYFEGVGELKPKGLKRAKGGAGALLSVQDAMARYTYAQKKAVRTNELYSEIVDTLGTIPNFGVDERTDYTDMKDTLYKDSQGQYLTAYRDGKQITTQINAELYNELSKNFENQVKNFEKNMELVLKPIQKINEIRRNILTTWSPTFPVTNAIKDIQDALLNSKYTKDMVANYPSAIKELATMSTDQVKQFVSLYGSGLTMGEFSQDTMNQKTKNIKFLNKIRQANEIIELAPRYAEFKASLKNGASLQEAMYNAREVTTNFGRGGVITKALNRNGATFLNASVQGFDKFIRNFSGENGAKGVVNSLIKAAVFGVAPALFNHLVFGDDDEEYEALPNYLKDNYYLIKLDDDGDFLRIPKGRMLSIFGSAARRTIEATEGNGFGVKDFIENAWNQTGVNNPADNNLFAPLFQAFGSKNGNAWYGGDIIPTRLQKSELEEREKYDESTDKFSIWLGDKLNISPMKINYVIDQYTGGIGDLVLPTITEEATSDGNLLAPIKDKFVTNSITKNKYVSEFYSTKESIKGTSDEAELQRAYLDSISWEMSSLYKEKREIQTDISLSKKEKFEKSQEIKKQINELAKTGLDGYQNVIVEGNYASVNDDMGYYKNSKGEWKSESIKDIMITNSNGLTDREKSNYYSTKNNIYQIKDKYSDSKDYAGRKKEIINEIINSNIPDQAKIDLYQQTYNDKSADSLISAGVSADTYLRFKAQSFSADKDKNGKSISGSKKQKVFNYINSMDIPFEQKVILAKSEYNKYNEYNRQIINYLNNQDIDYDTMKTILEDIGFKVKGNNISW